MEINRNNYEAYLLDLLEGRLTRNQEEELCTFLRDNPDCTLVDLVPEEWKLEKGQIRYPYREMLKKEVPLDPSEIDETDFELLSIARIEGELSGEQLAHHDALMREDPGKMKEWSMWKRTRLVAQPVIYPRKQRLQRGAGILRHLVPARWIVAVSTAAAVILLFLLFRPGAMLFDPGLQGPPLNLSMETLEPGESGESARIVEPGGTVEPGENVKPEDESGRNVEPGGTVEPGENVKPERNIEPGGTVEPGTSGETTRSGETRLPGTLSIKKQQDPPELTGTSARLRVTALVSQPATVPPEGTYDRIRPLAIPPSRVHTSGLSIARLSELDMEGVFASIAGEDELSFWSIAHSGIEGINRLAGTEMSLFAHRDEDGEISGIEFKSRIFSFTRPLDREE